MDQIEPFVGLFAFALLAVYLAQKYLTGGKATETLTCNGNLAQVKAALENLLITNPIVCQGTQRYWGPAQTISENQDKWLLNSSIYYENEVPDEFGGGYKKVLEKLTLTIKCLSKDSRTHLELQFDQNENALTPAQARQIINETRSAISRTLMNIKF